jgi:hypothetical protein
MVLAGKMAASVQHVIFATVCFMSCCLPFYFFALQGGSEWLKSMGILGETPQALRIEGSWDDRMKVSNQDGVVTMCMNSVAIALKLADGLLWEAFLLSFLVFGLLFICDAFNLLSWPAHWNVQRPWPTSDTEDQNNEDEVILKRFIYPGTPTGPNTSIVQRTYEEMFSEPPRVVFVTKGTNRTTVVKPALCCRPGNTYSNLPYLFAAIVVLSSNLNLDEHSSSNSEVLPFFLADVLFGTMLLLLSILSVCWHASNYNSVQYYDLWAMDFCIGYCMVRMICVGLAVPLASMLGYAHAREALALMGIICLAVAFLILVKSFVDIHTSSFPHGPQMRSCHFAGRRRLVRGELDIIGAAVFLGMPVLYILLPTFVQLFVLKDFGSVVLATATAGSLALGWTYRFSERFGLDGNPVMGLLWTRQEAFYGRARKGVLQRSSIFSSIFEAMASSILCFLLSPTAVLHWATGFTLLFSYAHARSLEQGLML